MNSLDGCKFFRRSAENFLGRFEALDQAAKGYISNLRNCLESKPVKIIHNGMVFSRKKGLID